LEDEGSGEIDAPPKIIGMEDGLLGPKGEPYVDDEEGDEPGAEEENQTGYNNGMPGEARPRPGEARPREG
jgi:hypothetical protein